MGSPQSYLILIIPIVTASVAQLLFKRGISSLGVLNFSFANLFSLILKILQNGFLVTGAIIFGISFLFYLFSLSKFQLSVIYPIFVSSGIVIVSLASWFFLKEGLSWLQISGIVVIIFGIFLLATK
ncbi:MAG: SMR family transporter [bacterium]|nr:SMR family transporter [bacterium]